MALQDTAVTAVTSVTGVPGCYGPLPNGSHKAPPGVQMQLLLLPHGQGLEIRNPFSGLYIPPSDVQKRHSISLEDIRRIQAECYKQDDELRHLVALISDTGMRLAEAVGLHQDDLVLDVDVPYVQVCEHPWRSLKTLTSSARKRSASHLVMER